jgi:uncharacterized protein YbjT (DUF2867 family)
MEDLMADPLILVTGGTGHLGRDLVARLLARGKRVRVLARLPGNDARVQWARGDLGSGEGLREALDGAHTVVHAATFSPVAQRGFMRLVDLVWSPRGVDIEGTRKLLTACQSAGVHHFVYVSIVGLDPANSFPYNRVKLAAETLVREVDLPWSIVRAEPFHYLLARLFASMRAWPWWVLPDAATQPVDTSDVAAYLAECVDDGRLGVREEIGGPEVQTLPDLAREYLAARGLHRRVFRWKVSAERARRLGFVPADGRRGTVTWHDWLATHDDEPKGRVRSRPQPAAPFSA